MLLKSDENINIRKCEMFLERTHKGESQKTNEKDTNKSSWKLRKGRE